jgi:hypothetical protein
VDLTKFCCCSGNLECLSEQRDWEGGEAERFNLDDLCSTYINRGRWGCTITGQLTYAARNSRKYKSTASGFGIPILRLR